MSAPALRLQQVHVRLGDAEVVRGVSLALPPARWTCIVGPNGAGKSTLLKAMAGLLPCEGRIELLGEDLRRLPRRTRARQLAWLGQSELGTDDLCVQDVVMLGRLPHQGWLATPSVTDWQAVEAALRATQAWDWCTRPLGQLSGGERQRVLLARALAVHAQVLLMDEPLNNLDPPHQVDWLHLVRAEVARGHTVVSVLHEVSMALQADEVLVLRQGQVQAFGSRDSAPVHRAIESVFDHRIRVVSVDGQWVALPEVVS